jgi:methane/ammonia monooxygenase subunit B
MRADDTLCLQALRRIGSIMRWVIALAIGLGAALDASAHGERAQEPYLRTRTVQFYDLVYDKTSIAVNQQFTVTGKFRLMEDWPDAVSQPEVVFLSTYSPGPVVTRVESYLNGLPARQSFGKLEKGRDYEFKIVLKGRVPGRYHIHPMLSIKGSGPLAGAGEWIEISGNKADFREPVTTMTGEKVDNLEFYGLGRALSWYGVWIALAAFWLLFWLVRPLLVPRWIALQKGREDLLVNGRDLAVGITLGVVVVGIVFGGYISAKKAYPYVVPLQAGTNKVEPLPRGKADVDIKVLKASYDVPGRSMRITARLTNKGSEPLSILEFTTANVRFINAQAPGAAQIMATAVPKVLVARGGLGLSDARPLQPGETREVKIDATDALWELERLVSFLTDVDSKFGGLLFFVNANGERQHAEIGGPILPVFTQI